MSFKGEVQVGSETGWSSNSIRFATREEARQYVLDLEGRWMLVRATRVVTSEDAVNSQWDATTRTMTNVASGAKHVPPISVTL